MNCMETESTTIVLYTPPLFFYLTNTNIHNYYTFHQNKICVSQGLIHSNGALPVSKGKVNIEFQWFLSS
jgi:hypothetical protein